MDKTYPARYQLQTRHSDQDTWRKYGSGSNSLEVIVERLRQRREVAQEHGHRTDWRVWDRQDQKDVVVS